MLIFKLQRLIVTSNSVCDYTTLSQDGHVVERKIYIIVMIEKMHLDSRKTTQYSREFFPMSFEKVQHIQGGQN